MTKGLFGRIQDEFSAREKTLGLDMTDILELPDNLREVINWMLRETYVDMAQVTAHLGNSEQNARTMIDTLLDKGYIREIDMKGRIQYRVRLKPKRKHDMPSNLWKALDDKTSK
jgi:Fic family protein